MGLEEVREEILNTAKEQSSSLIAEARKEANKIMKDAEKKVEEMKAKSDAEVKTQMDLIKRKELSSAEMKNKKILLDSKKQIIDGVFDDARKQLESMDDKKREAHIKKLIERAKGDIEPAYIYCSKKDAKFVKGFSVENINIIGGLIAENKDKTIRVDYTFETTLQAIKESELQNINKTLFG